MSDTTTFLILLGVTAAAAGALLVQLAWAAVGRKNAKVYDRLGHATSQAHTPSTYGSLVLQNRAGDLTQLAQRFAIFRAFNKRLRRVFPSMALSRFLALCVGCAILGFMGTYLTFQSTLMSAVAAAALFGVPFVVVNGRHARHERTMNDQLPEALEFLCRVLRAGHSFATGLQMGADELPDPLASEFRHCYDQHNLGHPLEDALRDMADRVGTEDFSFFVTSVLIQRTTGGELAEVLTNISNMVRARIRLDQRVKAVTAEGRMVGYILLVLPAIFFTILYVLNPSYAGVLLHTTEGSWLLGIALVMQVLGVVTIRRIVAVKL
jgi:tight adherence protein B